MTESQAKQFAEMFKMMQDLNDRSLRAEQGQKSLINTVKEIKENQHVIEAKINAIGTRLSLVETKVSALELANNEIRAKQCLAESTNFANRLDDLEDRSRRNNLVIYGIPDVQSETWAESEKKSA